jgi:metal-responsive CopG/Arc/MetJ family transcriptional regulator
MARTIVDIPDEQLREIDSLCRLLGIKSRAEIVRVALRDFVKRHDELNTDGFGLWRSNPPANASRRGGAR